MQQLLAQCPATGVIACDPDPAGIEIALDVGQIWSSCNLSWEPWNMDSATLMALPKRKLLTEGDRARLNRLLPQKLPRLLQELADWMDEHGEKGEQEGVFF
ncbi:MAG: hypothetical protein FIB02_12225 [Desulfuromonas sp.]|nr:hypothetical protein [Desulfuromonas sp.]